MINNDNILIYDIETILGYTLFSYYDPILDEYIDFSINEYENEYLELLKSLEQNQDKYFVGFNNINFDGQVKEHLWRNKDRLVLLSSKEFNQEIWQYAQDIIETSNHGGFVKYQEHDFSFKQLDLFRIQHFDNKNRRCGLKRLEFEMDAEDVREMNIPHTKLTFTPAEVKDLKDYCHNDIKETYNNYKYLIGDTTNAFYQGTNMIELREALSKTFNINCLNYSNSKYGDEIMKKIYSEKLGIDIKDLPKKGTFRKKLIFKNCIPDFIKFQTSTLNNFLNDLKLKEIKPSDKYEKTIKIGDRKHTFALGGLHSVTENESFIEDDEYELIDVDVSGYYVWTIISQKIVPKHLKKEFLHVVEWLFNERIKLKPLVKTKPEYKALVAGYKESAVSLYGKMGDPSNWMYDPQSRLHICIAGQLAILMLIEQLELEGFKCFMSNTDGASFQVKKSKKDLFFQICDKWCKDTTYSLEYTYFKKIFFQNVNSYTALTLDGKIKQKGSFLTSTELHKNKSFRVIALALEQYFINDIKVEDFIKSHDNIFDFVGRSTASKNKFYHEDIISKERLPYLIRYYPSNDNSAQKIMKIKDPKNPTNANNTLLSPAELKKITCNYLPKSLYSDHLSKVNRDWYIEECYKIINPIIINKKIKNKKFKDPNQISLF